MESSILNQYQNYHKNIIPQLDKEIQTYQLNDLYNKIESPLLKQELINSFKRRQLDLKFNTNEEIDQRKIVPTNEEDNTEQFQYLTFSHIKNVCHGDIEKFFEFSLQIFQKLFPSMNFGNSDFIQHNLLTTKTFSLLLSKENYLLIKMIERHVRIHKKTLQDMNLINKLENVNDDKSLDKLFNDWDDFLFIHSRFSDFFRKALFKIRFEEKIFLTFSNSFIQDLIVMQLVWSLFDKEIKRIFLDDNLLEQEMDNLLNWIKKHPYLENFHWNTEKLSELLIKIPFGITSINLIENESNFLRQPKSMQNYFLKDFIGFNSNLLYYGRNGTGGSCNLYFLSAWAYYQNILQIKLPSVYLLTQSYEIDMPIYNFESKLYLQPKFANKILEDFYSSNENLLEQIPVNMDLYGKFNFAGVHDDEPIPVPNFEIKNRKRKFYDVDEKFNITTVEQHTEEYKAIENHQDRIINHLPNPKNLKEVVEQGLKNYYLGTNVLAEVLEQLYFQKEIFVLNLIDDFNWFFRPSAYYGLQYADLKKLNHHIPPYHLAICRLFMRFDGHKMNHGMKIGATSCYTIRKHNFEPYKINYPNFITQKLNGVGYEGVKNFKEYMRLFELDDTKHHNEEAALQLWMLTQGNLDRLRRVLFSPELLSIYERNN